MVGQNTHNALTSFNKELSIAHINSSNTFRARFGQDILDGAEDKLGLELCRIRGVSDELEVAL